jgi:hypothetical protein
MQESTPPKLLNSDLVSNSELSDNHLNNLVRELLKRCKSRLACPNCGRCGNITKSSSNKKIRLQCSTKGLNNGTKKGFCNKSWSLVVAMKYLRYATEVNTTGTIVLGLDQIVTTSSSRTAMTIKNVLKTRNDRQDVYATEDEDAISEDLAMESEVSDSRDFLTDRTQMIPSSIPLCSQMPKKKEDQSNDTSDPLDMEESQDTILTTLCSRELIK